MRKAPIFALNIRKSYALLYLTVFSFTIISATVLSTSNIKVNINPAIIKKILLSSTAFSEKQSMKSRIFPFLLINEKNTDSMLKSEEITEETPSTTIQKTLGENLSVKVSNLTDAPVNTASLMKTSPTFLSESPEVLIIHSHTSESYTPSEKYAYTPTDTFRTLDYNYNMAVIGKKIKSVLEKNDIAVYHDITINDYPSYNQSYNKSCKLAEKYISEHPKIKIVLDVHRDAITSSDGKNIKYTSNIDGKEAACIMMVVGSSLSGLAHDNWNENMSFALLLQEHINSVYPSLMRPINFRKQRFNQHLAPGTIIIEVGSNGNTLDEALLGAECFANALSSFLKTTKTGM